LIAREATHLLYKFNIFSSTQAQIYNLKVYLGVFRSKIKYHQRHYKIINHPIPRSAHPSLASTVIKTKTFDPLRGAHSLAVTQRKPTTSPELSRGKRKANRGQRRGCSGPPSEGKTVAR
jgi:hypothetical protein